MELHHLNLLRAEGQSYIEFLRRPDFSAGVYRLAAGADDPQQPHSEDEMYYVVAGKAKFQGAGRVHDVAAGDIIFVPAREPHHFQDITEALEVLVFFAPAEGQRK